MRKNEEKGKSSEEEKLEKEIIIPNRCVQPVNGLNLGKIKEVESELQLLLYLTVYFENGKKTMLRVLIDTGSQANLVNEKVVPNETRKQTNEVIRLAAATRQRLRGGDKKVEMEIGFQVQEWKNERPSNLFLKGSFYVASIGLDAILSYPWLKQNKLGVYPHLQALAFDHPSLTVLTWWWAKGMRGCTRKRKQRNRRRRVGVIETSTGGSLSSETCMEENVEEMFGDERKSNEIMVELKRMQLHIPNEEGELESALTTKELRYIACVMKKVNK